MKAQEITVGIEIGIDLNTAELCAKVVETYLNQNPHMGLDPKVEDGRCVLTIVEVRREGV